MFLYLVWFKNCTKKKKSCILDTVFRKPNFCFYAIVEGFFGPL